jgi:adenine-specific DNA-methyltransferase
MSNKKTKLELTWIGKENRARLEPRILLEDPDKSYHAKQWVTDNDLFDNRLIFGDNLLALKALEQEFTGKVKCIFIDPPYNTGSAFTHYDDGLEHSIWLSLMRDRLELLRSLLSAEGSIWISIDDNESHYLKVVCDEVFGRPNFVGNVIWHKKYSPQNDDKGVTRAHDHILSYAKDINSLKVNLLPRSNEMDARYKNPDNDPKGPWKSGDLTSKTKAKGHSYPIIGPDGQVHMPPPGRQWAPSLETYNRWLKEGKIWFGKTGKNRPSIKQYLSEVQQGIVPLSIWFRDEVGDNQEAKREVTRLNSINIFETPKPERLMMRILTLATNAGDIVLDSFLGSGTTAAVAHKMRRQWIGIELGDHCHTHCLPRLNQVVDGTDAGGITEAVGWKGGGGFRYYRLAPSLLSKDKWGNWVISQDYNAPMLAEAVCKLEGFTYAPSDTHYWQHGHSSERDFIYTTTANLNHVQLQQLSEEVGPDRSLLVICSAFRGSQEGYPNLTVKKIPKAVLSRCEWGKDDYSLKVENLPKSPMKAGQMEMFEKGGKA